MADYGNMWWDDTNKKWTIISDTTKTEVINGKTMYYGPMPIKTVGTVETLWQDPTNVLFAQPFMRAEQPPTTLATGNTINTYTLDVTSATGMTAGDIIFIASTDGKYYRGGLLSILGTVLTMDTPLDYAFSAGDVVLDMTQDMNVNGSVTPVTFSVGPGGGIVLDITRIILVMRTTDPCDLSTWGDLAALTNGCIMRIAYSDGSYKNMGAAKTNGHIANICYDVEFHDAAKFGENGFAARWTFSDPSKMGAVIRLEDGDSLEYIIQDDITGLLSFTIMAEGHEANT